MGPKIGVALEAYETNLARALGESQAARLAGEDRLLSAAERKAREKAELERQVAALPLAEQRRFKWGMFGGRLIPFRDPEVPDAWR